MKNKPNIIYIFTDQHRGDTLGAMGHQTVITPNLDALAEEGFLFSKCYTNSPLCMPARASMMTGKTVCEHGVWDNHTEANPKKEPSHVRNIKEAGYHTALIGKTHLYSKTTRNFKDLREQTSLLKDWGYEESHETSGYMGSLWNDSIYSDYLKEKGLLRTFHQFYGAYHKRWSSGKNVPWDLEPSPLPPEDCLDSFVGCKAVEWIESYKRDDPFYLQILFPGPHDPFASPQKYRDLYNPADISPAIMEFPDEPVPFYTNMVLKWSNLKGMTAEQNQLYRSYYYAKITLIDEWIGKIVATLRQKGLLENTWIVYSSDHGEMLGDHMLNHKVVFYENAIQVPCIICPPKGTKGRKIEIPVDLIDLTATFINIAGAKPLKDARGVSLLPLIFPENKNFPPVKRRDAIFSEVLGFTMVRTEKFKFVISSKKKVPVEFYDLTTDPKELHNRVNDPDYKIIQKELLRNYLKPHLKRLNRKKFRIYRWKSVKRFLFSKNSPDWVKEAISGKK